MEEFIESLNDPEICQNLAELFTDLAKKARLKAIELKANKTDALTKVEKELYKAIFAYEDLLKLKNKRTTRASRTWQMVKKYGIIEAAEKAVDRPVEPMGYYLLKERGLKDLTFEAVILKYPKEFNPEVVKLARERLDELDGKMK